MSKICEVLGRNISLVFIETELEDEFLAFHWRLALL